MSPKLLNLLLLMASGAMYYLLITPLYSGADTGFWPSGEENINTLKTKIATYDATIKGINGVSQSAKNLKKKYEEYDQETKNKMAIMVPDSVNELILLNELTRLANETEVPAENVGIRDKGGEYSVSFTVQTTYTKFKEFITHWERSQRLMTLQSVSFNPGKADEDILKFNVELSTYYMDTKKAKK